MVGASASDPSPSRSLGTLVRAWSARGQPVPVAVVVSIFDDLLALAADAPVLPKASESSGTNPLDTGIVETGTAEVGGDLRSTFFAIDDVDIEVDGRARLGDSDRTPALGLLLAETLGRGLGDDSVPAAARALLARLDSEDVADRPRDADELRSWLRDALGPPAPREEVKALVDAAVVEAEARRWKMALSSATGSSGTPMARASSTKVESSVDSPEVSAPRSSSLPSTNVRANETSSSAGEAKTTGVRDERSSEDGARDAGLSKVRPSNPDVVRELDSDAQALDALNRASEAEAPGGDHSSELAPVSDRPSPEAQDAEAIPKRGWRRAWLAGLERVRGSRAKPPRNHATPIEEESVPNEEQGPPVEESVPKRGEPSREASVAAIDMAPATAPSKASDSDLGQSPFALDEDAWFRGALEDLENVPEPAVASARTSDAPISRARESSPLPVGQASSVSELTPALDLGPAGGLSAAHGPSSLSSFQPESHGLESGTTGSNDELDIHEAETLLPSPAPRAVAAHELARGEIAGRALDAFIEQGGAFSTDSADDELPVPDPWDSDDNPSAGPPDKPEPRESPESPESHESRETHDSSDSREQRARNSVDAQEDPRAHEPKPPKRSKRPKRPRGPKESKEPKETKARKESSESKDAKASREVRQTSESTDANASREVRQTSDTNGTKATKEINETKETGEANEPALDGGRAKSRWEDEVPEASMLERVWTRSFVRGRVSSSGSRAPMNRAQAANSEVQHARSPSQRPMHTATMRPIVRHRWSRMDPPISLSTAPAARASARALSEGGPDSIIVPFDRSRGWLVWVIVLLGLGGALYSLWSGW